MFCFGFDVMALAASQEFRMVMTIGIKQNFNRHAEESGRFPRVGPALHQPGCGRMP
jgi:hypothetical protein